jgi:hypothetical protein
MRAKEKLGLPTQPRRSSVVAQLHEVDATYAPKLIRQPLSKSGSVTGHPE